MLMNVVFCQTSFLYDCVRIRVKPAGIPVSIHASSLNQIRSEAMSSFPKYCVSQNITNISDFPLTKDLTEGDTQLVRWKWISNNVDDISQLSNNKCHGNIIILWKMELALLRDDIVPWYECCFWNECLKWWPDVALRMNSDAAILLWKINDSKEVEQTPSFQEEEDAQLNKESWNVVKTLRSSLSLFFFFFGYRLSIWVSVMFIQLSVFF